MRVITSTLEVRYLRYHEIDSTKWDNCIAEASNGLIYAYSWYLNALCEDWDALVMDDYKAVMPLPNRKKWGIQYLYQPFFCASLGVFAGNTISPEDLECFLKSIPKQFAYWDICLNYGNNHALKAFKTILRNNYTLPLHQPYETISQQYRTNLKRNLERAQKNGLSYSNNIDELEVIELAKPTMGRFAHIQQKDWDGFLNVVEQAKKRNCCEIVGVHFNQQLVASAIFFYSHQRWYYILAGNHPNGKTLGASHLLLDRFIAKHAGTDTLLDFEGSDAESLAFFYSSFGAQTEIYPALKINKLPAPLRWFK